MLIPTQIAAILMLLNAFGVDPSVIAQVSIDLNAPVSEVSTTTQDVIPPTEDTQEQGQQDQPTMDAPQAPQAPIAPIQVAFVDQPSWTFSDNGQFIYWHWSTNVQANGYVVGCYNGVNPVCQSPTVMSGTEFDTTTDAKVFRKYKVVISANGTTATATGSYPQQ